MSNGTKRIRRQHVGLTNRWVATTTRRRSSGKYVDITSPQCRTERRAVAYVWAAALFDRIEYGKYRAGTK